MLSRISWWDGTKEELGQSRDPRRAAESKVEA